MQGCVRALLYVTIRYYGFINLHAKLPVCLWKTNTNLPREEKFIVHRYGLFASVLCYHNEYFEIKMIIQKTREALYSLNLFKPN